MDTRNVVRFLRSLQNDPPFYEDYYEVPVCAACHNRPGVACCSHCQTAWYCSRHCRKAHYNKGHKQICCVIVEAQNRVNRMAIPLRRLFETQVGNFISFRETRAYLEACCDLMDLFVQAAQTAASNDVWEKALFYALEVQRLEATGLVEVRSVNPFLLLNLHRDDDAFNFMRYWMKSQGTLEETRDSLLPFHAGTQKGDWIYPREPKCRFLNFFETCPDRNDRNVPVEFLVALLIIKCRILVAIGATCKSANLALGSVNGQRIHEVHSTVTEMVIDGELVNIESQRQQADQLVDAIHRENAIILPAILNPAPLLNSELPQSGARAAQCEEALNVLMYCARCLLRVSGAKEMLERRFGHNPSYSV